MINEATTVVGKAVYLELRSSDERSTFQMIITPQCRVPSNPSRVIYPVVYRRQLSHHAPKRTWKVNTPSHSDFSEPGATESETVQKRLRFIDTSLQRLVNAGFKVYKEPIVVEVSAADIDAIAAYRTPYKVVGRIEKVRKAKGFPKHPLVGKS